MYFLREVIFLQEMTAVKTPKLRYQKVNEVDPNNHQIESALCIFTTTCYFSVLPHLSCVYVQTKEIYPTHLIFLSSDIDHLIPIAQNTRQKSSCEN